MEEGQMPPDRPGEEKQVPAGTSLWIYRLPIYFLLPSSIAFEWCDYMLAVSSGGTETSIFRDVVFRAGGLWAPMAFLQAIGIVFWVFALGAWLVSGRKDPTIRWRCAIALAIGLCSIGWVFFPLVEWFIGAPPAGVEMG